MGFTSILSSTIALISSLSKKSLVKAIILLRDKYLKLEAKNNSLSESNKELERENKRLLALQVKAKVIQVNKTSCQPSSKQPEWELKGVGNDGEDKKKGRGKKGRKGAGNKPKNVSVTKKELEKVEKCIFCDKDLSTQAAYNTVNTRIIEDIPELPASLEVIEVVQEKKYCHHCKRTITARSSSALPKSDFGLNTTIAIVYFWIYSCLSLPRIAGCLKDFFSLKISTSGISAHLIRVSKIFEAVYQEILQDINLGTVLHADETGWRVKGDNWWLWVFGTTDSAY
jgi:transposase